MQLSNLLDLQLQLDDRLAQAGGLSEALGLFE